MRTISVKLPDDLLSYLDRAAKERRVTRWAIVGQSLEAALRRQPANTLVFCYDLARDLAGTAKGFGK